MNENTEQLSTETELIVLLCLCGLRETITIAAHKDLHRVASEKGYCLVKTQHGRVIGVVCPDCRSAYKC